MSIAGPVLIVWLVVLWIAPIFVAVPLGRSKDRAGFFYGFFLGWLGVIILALLPRHQGGQFRECPHCRENIRRDASACPHCQRDVEPLPAQLRPRQSRWRCGECGKPFKAGLETCPNCGVSITAPENAFY